MQLYDWLSSANYKLAGVLIEVKTVKLRVQIRDHLYGIETLIGIEMPMLNLSFGVGGDEHVFGFVEGINGSPLEIAEGTVQVVGDGVGEGHRVGVVDSDLSVFAGRRYVFVFGVELDAEDLGVGFADCPDRGNLDYLSIVIGIHRVLYVVLASDLNVFLLQHLLRSHHARPFSKCLTIPFSHVHTLITARSYTLVHPTPHHTILLYYTCLLLISKFYVLLHYIIFININIHIIYTNITSTLLF